jgi:hypothetical protein
MGHPVLWDILASLRDDEGEIHMTRRTLYLIHTKRLMYSVILTSRVFGVSCPRSLRRRRASSMSESASSRATFASLSDAPFSSLSRLMACMRSCNAG